MKIYWENSSEMYTVPLPWWCQECKGAPLHGLAKAAFCHAYKGRGL